MNLVPPVMISLADITGPYNHPSVVRENREISRLLAGILVKRGRSAHQARREAEALLPHIPPAYRESGLAVFKEKAG